MNNAQKDGNPVASKADVRLELLRLVHRHDKDAATVIARAREYEAYVQEEPAGKPAKARQGKGNAPG